MKINSNFSKNKNNTNSFIPNHKYQSKLILIKLSRIRILIFYSFLFLSIALSIVLFNFTYLKNYESKFDESNYNIQLKNNSNYYINSTTLLEPNLIEFKTLDLEDFDFDLQINDWKEKFNSLLVFNYKNKELTEIVDSINKYNEKSHQLQIYEKDHTNYNELQDLKNCGNEILKEKIILDKIYGTIIEKNNKIEQNNGQIIDLTNEERNYENFDIFKLNKNSKEKDIYSEEVKELKIEMEKYINMRAESEKKESENIEISLILNNSNSKIHILNSSIFLLENEISNFTYEIEILKENKTKLLTKLSLLLLEKEEKNLEYNISSIIIQMGEWETIEKQQELAEIIQSRIIILEKSYKNTNKNSLNFKKEKKESILKEQNKLKEISQTIIRIKKKAFGLRNNKFSDIIDEKSNEIIALEEKIKLIDFTLQTYLKEIQQKKSEISIKKKEIEAILNKIEEEIIIKTENELFIEKFKILDLQNKNSLYFKEEKILKKEKFTKINEIEKTQKIEKIQKEKDELLEQIQIIKNENINLDKDLKQKLLNINKIIYNCSKIKKSLSNYFKINQFYNSEKVQVIESMKLLIKNFKRNYEN